MKKSMLILICVLLCMFVFTAGVSAATPAPWDGTADTSWYNAEDTTFEIDTPEEFAGLATLVNKGTDKFQGKTIKLMADIDLGGVKISDSKLEGMVFTPAVWDAEESKNWSPIGPDSWGNYFAGTFDGNGHKISNMYISSKSGYAGLFGNVSGVIKDLTLESGFATSTNTYSPLGTLVGNLMAGGYVYHCENGAEVSGKTYNVGMVGQNLGTIAYSINKGNMYSTSYYVGGITGACGNYGGAGKVIGCVNEGIVSGRNRVGGIVGSLGNGNIANSYNVGTVAAYYSSSTSLGGIVGQCSSASYTIVNCYNAGEVRSIDADGNDNYKYVGGIFGGTNASVVNSYYLADGGLLGSGNADGAVDFAGTESKSADELKGLAETLGSAFAADSKNINNGYPVLTWQNSGEYSTDLDETAGISVSAVTDGTISGFTVYMNRMLEYTALSAGDFTVKATVNGVDTTLNSLRGNYALMEKDGKLVSGMTFTFDSVTPESDIVFSVAYKETEAVTYSFTAAPTDQWYDYADGSDIKGEGTINDPYQISTPVQLAYVTRMASANNYWADKFFVLANDIDLKGKYWTSGIFNGNLDGQNFTIRNLSANREGSYFDCVGGLFSTVNDRTSGKNKFISYISNVHFENVQIENAYSAGALAGKLGVGVVENCSVKSGSIQGSLYAGGLIGQTDATTNMEVLITRCSSAADVTAQNAAGGIVGNADHGNTSYGVTRITDCWSTGNITAKGSSGSFAGGIMGSVARQLGVEIENCYTTATVSGAGTAVGGIIGKVWITGNNNQVVGAQGLTVKNSVALNPSVNCTNTDKYTTGRVAGNATEMMEAGKGSFSNNYGIDTMNLAGVPAWDDENANGISVSRDQVWMQNFWVNTMGFDFESVWKWNTENNCPVLNTENQAKVEVTLIAQPLDATAYRGKDAMFGVIAEGGSLNYSYQWESSSDGEEWAIIEGATTDAFNVAYNGDFEAGAQFRCVVSDHQGHSVTSDAATLDIVTANYTPYDAVDDIVAYYTEKGIFTYAGEPFAAMGVIDDISEIPANIPYYDSYYTNSSRSESVGRVPFALLDSYALGVDPHEYVMSGKGDTEPSDYIAYVLDHQNSETGEISADGYAFNEYTFAGHVLALEMYFDGGVWGNESEGSKLGRDGAIERIFALLKDHSCGGLLFHNIAANDGNFSNAILTSKKAQMETIILMSRLVDDPVWGEQAEDAMHDLLKTAEYLYEEGSFTETEVLAYYVSALIAGADVTDSYFKNKAYLDLADEIVQEKLIPSASVDGGYNATVGQQTMTCDPYATAAVAMALGDYERESSLLATYVFGIPDTSAVSNDLNNIVLPNPVTGDLVLPTEGSYGSTLVWESSDPNVVSTSGKVNRGGSDAAVTLSVTATKGEISTTKTYELIVKADADGDTDAVDAVLAALNVPNETTSDLVFAASSDETVTLTWSSSNETVIAPDGTVVRPAIGADDVDVIVTATAAKGAVTKTKTFPVKVYAQTGDSLKEGYYASRIRYLNDRDLNGYWEVFSAYAALGEYINDPANGYTVTYGKPDSTWFGTQYGAQVLALVLTGENPYNYDGKNWVELLDKNYGGAFAGGVYSALGMEIAAAGPEYYSPSAAAGMSQIKPEAMKAGIDIAGWGAVLVAAHYGMDESGEDVAAVKTYLSHLKGMGIDEDGNFGGTNYISGACTLLGLAALNAVGVEDADPTLPAWENALTGNSVIDACYNQGIVNNRIPGYEEQIELGLCDLYNSKYLGKTATWLTDIVSKENLDVQIAKANEILENRDDYEVESIKAIEDALEVVNGISEERLNAKISDFGEEYYTLYDAVRYAKTSEQSVLDAEAADVVTEQLSALDAATDITMDDKETVEAARAAYDALTNAQKAMVDEAALAKLIEAETTIAAIEKAAADTEAAKAVEDAISAISDEVTLADKETVEAARVAYDALTDEQKALVNTDLLTKLTAAEETIAALEETPVVDLSVFTDISEEDWFYGDVAYVLTNGIFKGTSATTFAPNDAITRAMFVTVLGRYAGVEDSSATYPVRSSFNDVTGSEYYASHVEWAVENGITVGVGGNNFAPNNNITRQDMATMMIRYAKAMDIELPEADTELFADDAMIRDYAKAAVYSLKSAGILNGKGDNLFIPEGTATRAEVSAVLHRFLTYDPTADETADLSNAVVVSMEKLTLGQGYVIEPVVVKLQEGDTAADVIVRLMEERGLEYTVSQSSSTFYLSKVKDNDTSEANIPGYILDAFAADGIKIGERDEENWLGEFDYHHESGWMYFVNNVKPVNESGMELGAAQYTMQAGDVMRWQFSVIGMGADIGSGVGGVNLIEMADKDDLLTAVAAASKNQKSSDAYAEALTVLRDLEASQEEVDTALANLVK